MHKPDLKYLRPLSNALAWALLLLIAAVMINVLGDMQSWHDWVRDHALGLLLWRLGLYAALIYGWLRMRTRLLLRAQETRPRLRRTEVAGIAALMLLEVSNLLSGLEAP